MKTSVCVWFVPTPGTEGAPAEQRSSSLHTAPFYVFNFCSYFGYTLISSDSELGITNKKVYNKFAFLGLSYLPRFHIS